MDAECAGFDDVRQRERRDVRNSPAAGEKRIFAQVADQRGVGQHESQTRPWAEQLRHGANPDDAAPPAQSGQRGRRRRAKVQEPAGVVLHDHHILFPGGRDEFLSAVE